jgi:hypothetical protein
MRKFFKYAVRGKVLVFSLIAGLQASGLPVEDRSVAIKTQTNAYFEIVGTDNKSVQTIGQLSRASLEVCGKYLKGIPANLPQRVTILLDSKFKPEGKPYVLTLEAGGFVTLRLAWNESFSLEAACHAMTEALLLRYVYYHHGKSAPSQMRAWVATGLGQKLFLKFRPAQLEYYQKRLPELKSQSVQLIIEATGGEPCEGVAAYWFFKALESSGLKRRAIADAVEAALVGQSIAKTLPLMPDLPIPEALEDWWQTSIDNFTGQTRGAVDTMEASRRWLEALSKVQGITGEGEGASPVRDLRELSIREIDADLKTIIAARRNLLLGGMLRVNPIYYNAAQSLGKLYEQILAEEKGYRMTATLIDYLNDLSGAERMQALVDKALSEPKSGGR